MAEEEDVMGDMLADDADAAAARERETTRRRPETTRPVTERPPRRNRRHDRARDAAEATRLRNEIGGLPEGAIPGTEHSIPLGTDHRVETWHNEGEPDGDSIRMNMRIVGNDGTVVVDLNRELPSHRIYSGDSLRYHPGGRALELPTRHIDFDERMGELLPFLFHEIAAANAGGTPEMTALVKAAQESRDAEAAEQPDDPETTKAVREAHEKYYAAQTAFEASLWKSVGQRAGTLRSEKKFDLFAAFPTKRSFEQMRAQQGNDLLIANGQPELQNNLPDIDELDHFFKERGGSNTDSKARKITRAVSRGAVGTAKWGGGTILGGIIAGLFVGYESVVKIWEKLWDIEMDGKSKSGGGGGGKKK